MNGKFVYTFGGGYAEGKAEMKELLGGKGAGLAEMANLGLPVPPGFTITTEVCGYYYDHGKTMPKELEAQVLTGLARVEKLMDAKFGDAKKPLLVSVRSGARASMPGMMDTILNLGINEEIVDGLAKQTNNPRFAWDSYRRFIQMYGDVVMGLKPENKDERDPFEIILEAKKEKLGIKFDQELTVEALKELVNEYKKAIKSKLGVDLPNNPMEQLWGAIMAVFNSWNNERAIAYRRLNGYPDDWGTAVNVQAMVFGNMGKDSGSGVAFTRNPATGENEFYGEYLIDAQGEDVVAGTRTPLPVSELKKESPTIYEQLISIRAKLEARYRDAQDIEFTVQKGKLFMLQTRNAKRTGLASLRIANDMVTENLVSPQEALMQMEPNMLNQLLQPIFDLKALAQAMKESKVLAKGLPAGPGAASGHIVFNAQDAVALKQKLDAEAKGKGHGAVAEGILLVRHETSPEDIQGMVVANGILTARGGMTSHAALVARQMGKVCIVGCEAIEPDYEKHTLKIGKKIFKEGDWLSLDGTLGNVIEGRIDTMPSEIVSVLIKQTMKPADAPTYQLFERFMGWADAARKLLVRANADTPEQSRTAIAFGAQGIGLCRTEHMFFGDKDEEKRTGIKRINLVREMILASNEKDRLIALDKLLPLQRGDFEGIFRAMQWRPVTIRTLDPPLHEFLPHKEEEIQELSVQMKVSTDTIKEKVKELHEFNPMLGHRGCRLGIVFPEITAMQARAIIEAACNLKLEGVNVSPEIMIPLVGNYKELENQAAVVHKAAEAVFKEKGIRVDYMVGTMIELPRACLTADKIASVAQFFSFGTNDLTQTTYGLSRDDAGKFLRYYIDHGIYAADPFERLDQEGVGQLVEMGVCKGRSVRSDLKVGICGEHGGEPSSVEFCHRTGLNYVSCSPFRIPIARLAAAQAAIKDLKAKK